MGIATPTKTLPPFPSDIRTAPLVTISLAKLLASDAAEHGRLFEASKALGFLYLDMRGCPEGDQLLQLADTLFDLMGEFFHLPVEQRQEFDFAAKGTFAGYKGIGKEVIDRNGTRDRIEIYNMPKDDILHVSSTPYPMHSLITKNQPVLAKYTDLSDTVLQTLFSSLNTSLRLPAGTLSSLHRLSSPSGCHVRFICAPPQPIADRRTALAEHTDFGSLTILFNRVGGLQVQLPGPEKEWVYVKPVRGCAIVNLGDAMVKFTRGLLRSNLHRVVSPPGEQSEETRYSLVYFCRPENAVVMKPLEGGVVDELKKEGDEEETGESSAEWLKRRHLGRKVEYFKGPESWDQAKGTEGTRA